MQWTNAVMAVIGFLAGVVATLIAAGRFRLRSAAKDVPVATSIEQAADKIKQLAPFEEVFESAGIGLYSWTLKDDTVRWSNNHYKIFGWPLETAATHATFQDRVHPADIQLIDDAIGEAFHHRSGYSVGFRICLPDGSIRYIHGSGRIICHPDGEPRGMDGVVIDMSRAAPALDVMWQHNKELAIAAGNRPDVRAAVDMPRSGMETRCASR